MQAIEFNTFLSEGFIKVPTAYRKYFNKNARIIILISENEPDTNYDKQKLLSAFQKAKKLKVFKNISNSQEWQKKLRDEWE